MQEGGDIELVWTRERKNMVKLLLVMDYRRVHGPLRPAGAAGSSPRPIPAPISRIFKYFYFHNCVYQDMYKDMGTMEDYQNRRHAARISIPITSWS